MTRSHYLIRIWWQSVKHDAVLEHHSTLHFCTIHRVSFVWPASAAVRLLRVEMVGIAMDSEVLRCGLALVM